MPAGYYRQPTIHQDTVVFVCEDDLWTVPSTGGVARRLTANLGTITFPALSPEGQTLAFTGQEEGLPEVFSMSAQGGPVQRLTYLGVNTYVVGWHPQGKTIIFASDTAQPFRQHHHLYQISAEGGQPELLSAGPAKSVSYGPDGGLVIGRNTTSLSHWKRYRGGLTGDLWIDRQGNNEWQRLIKLDGNIARPLWVGERIYFVSDHEGVGNLYSCLSNGEDLQRHTAHRYFYVRDPASDGERIVYQAGADLYLFNPAENQSRQMEIEFYSPRVQRSRKFVNAEEFLQSYGLHPAGHSVALVSRGKPFVMANWEKAVIQQGQLQGVRYRLATWLKDGNRLVIISDAGGEEALEIHYADAGAKPVRLDTLNVGRVTGIAASPKKDQVALTNHRHELVLVDLETPSVTIFDQSRFRPIQSFEWSPDGLWLVYSFYNTRQTSLIKLCRVDTGETWEITRPVLRDISPSFDPDGKYLYFLSYRDFNPVYDNLHFDLGFLWGVRPYLITLQADLESPFLPVPRPPGEKPPKPEDDSDNGDEPADSEDSETKSDSDKETSDEDKQEDMNFPRFSGHKEKRVTYKPEENNEKNPEEVQQRIQVRNARTGSKQ